MKLLSRIDRRKRAKSKIFEIADDIKNVSAIHYSCESFYERPNGTSPRITSIAIKNLDTAQTKSFSIHQIAEIKNISLDQIDSHYDKLEKDMLTRFYDFVDHNSQMKYLHWNMRDINYGFEALAHRFNVFGCNPKEIPQVNLYDLARILIEIFGIHYIGHPRLLKIVEKNHITDLNFLSGQEEASAFEHKEYVKLHLSTLRKVDTIANIFGRLTDGSLKHNATFKEIYGNLIGYFVESIQEHPIYILSGILVTVFSLIQIIWGLF